MNISSFPVRQGELIKLVRGPLSQAAFARQLQVSRSCLSRYESEKLGAPTVVINHCLGAIAAQLSGLTADGDPLQRALQLSRDTTRQLEQVTLQRSG